jgi:hypothetical protein
MCAVAVLFVACSEGEGIDADEGSASVGVTATTAASPTSLGDVGGDQGHPDVIRAEAAWAGDGWTFSATISSPYDTAQRYADAWRVVAPDGTVLGVRELAHHHAGEQPFTRSLAGVAVPSDVDRVTVEARDLANGWGGATVQIELARG